MALSEHNIPATCRHMQGFGVARLQFHQREERAPLGEVHFMLQQGIKNLTIAEAKAIIGKDRESHRGDLDGTHNSGCSHWYQAQISRSAKRPAHELAPRRCVRMFL